MSFDTSRISRRAVMGGLASGAGLVAMPAVLRAQTLNWIAASATPASDFIAQSLDFFGKRLGELSKGQIKVASHHAGSLGGEREHVEGLLQGVGQPRKPGPGAARRLVPAGRGLDPPLSVQGRAAQEPGLGHDPRRVHPGHGVAEAKLRPVAAIPRMPRQLSCNKVVKTPADMKGLKIRVPETALWRRTFELMGSSPTPLPFPEVFQALKSKIIDGQENPIALTYNSGIFDANTHLSLTEHMMQDNCILMAEAQYQRLSADQKKMVDQASRDVEAEMRPKVEEDDRRILELVKQKKIVISEVDKAAFAASVKDLVKEFPAGQRWVERIRQVA